MNLEVVEYPAAVLSKPARRVNDGDAPELGQLYRDMVETMIEYRGIGLAAPQVGRSVRFMIAHNSRSGETQPFVNPQIVSASVDTEIQAEGCLSFPGRCADIERHLVIIVKYQDLDLQTHEEQFSGYFARVIQHELDHLNGVLLPDRAIDGLYEPEYEDEDDGDGNSAEPAGTVNEPANMAPEES